MRLARFRDGSETRPAVVQGDTVIDVADLVDDYNPAFFEGDVLARLGQADISGRRGLELETVQFAAPLASTGQIYCIGLNYRLHAIESNQEIPTEPILFGKAANTLSGPFDDIRLPPGSEKTDWEVELAVIIGRRCRYLPNLDTALDHVAGYAVSNDVSERHWQLERGGQWIKGKSFESFNPLGPYLVTHEQGFDPQALELWLSVNSTQHQQSTTADMIFPVAHIIWYLSQFVVLEPGDIINTGTPAGVGLGLTPPTYLKAGDVVELGISGLGSQRQVCRPASVASDL